MSNGRDFYGCAYDTSSGTSDRETRDQRSAVLQIMRPKPSPFALLRIGGTGDGAYLIPDDLDDVRICFSPGVSNRKSFEDQIAIDHTMTCHMCDHNSDESKFLTPLIAGRQTFDKLWLEPQSGADRIDLRSWIRRFYPDGHGDMLLQMDIEGAEYRNILAADADTLRSFRIIVIEVHGLSKINDPAILETIIAPFFHKIGAIFTCIHAHPNNNSSLVTTQDRTVALADVMELTFLRSDVLMACPARDRRPVLLPHPLDITNTKHKPPIVLDEFWCDGGRPIEAKLKIVEDELAYQKSRAAQLADDVTIGISKAIAGAFRLALSGAVLKGVAVADRDREAPASLEEVAAGRRFELSSSWTGAKTGRVEGGRVEAGRAFFFHTQFGWDQSITIDLEDARVLHAMVIVNRRDARFDRAGILQISLLMDGKSDAGGRTFHLDVPEAFTSGRELGITVAIPSVPARFLRISSPVYTALHFAELRVYAGRR